MFVLRARTNKEEHLAEHHLQPKLTVIETPVLLLSLNHHLVHAASVGEHSANPIQSRYVVIQRPLCICCQRHSQHNL